MELENVGVLLASLLVPSTRLEDIESEESKTHQHPYIVGYVQDFLDYPYVVIHFARYVEDVLLEGLEEIYRSCLSRSAFPREPRLHQLYRQYLARWYVQGVAFFRRVCIVCFDEKLSPNSAYGL